jgi:protein kinase-like protein
MNDLTNCKIEALREDGEFAVARAKMPGGLASWLVVRPILEQPAPASLAKLEHAFALRSELDATWAARPVALTKFGGRPALLIDDPGGQFVDELIVGPLAVPELLRLAIGIVASLRILHSRGMVHKDVKPANLIANDKTGEAWLTGFGLATRLPRHRQSAELSEIIAGTLAYMAPSKRGE